MLIVARCFTYALQSIDKTTLSYAAVFGIREDTALAGSEFSWLGAIFYLGYMIWEWPTSVLLQKLPLGKFLGASVSASYWFCQRHVPDLLR
jgi:ACS family allantoate permease-like MFS transporter